MRPSLNDIRHLVITSVNEIIQSWNLDVTTRSTTKLIDELGFSSMEFIDLLATLETQLKQRLPYERLLITGEGTYREELTVEELSAFIYDTFDQPRPISSAI
jgi:acyl carrier protein